MKDFIITDCISMGDNVSIYPSVSTPLNRVTFDLNFLHVYGSCS